MVKRDSFVAESYSGADYSSGAENLDPSWLPVAENWRFTNLGGAATRTGFELYADLGTSAAVDSIHTHEPYSVMFAKSGTAIKQSLNGTTWYDIGVTRTATEIDDFLSVEKDVHVSNPTDNYTRIAVTTLRTAITVASTEIDLRVGDGGKFGTSGTVYIEGDSISYGGRTGDQLTSVTNISASHSVGAIITETSAPSSAPKASCLGLLEGATLAGGVAANRAYLYYSAHATGDNPEFAYDYTANGANFAPPFPTDIVDINSITGGSIIALKKGIHYASTFDVNSEELLITEIHNQFGGVNNRCLVQGQKMTYLLDAKNKRIVPIVNDQNGVNVLDDPNKQKNNLDYPVQGFMAGIDEDQSLSSTSFDPVTTEVVFTVYKNGFSHDVVLQENVNKWSIDIGKNFKCRTNFNGKSICGSDYNAEIYLNNSGLTDNTVGIHHRLLSPVYNIDDKRVTMEFLDYVCGGLLSSLGEFTLRMYVNDLKVFDQLVTADMLVAANLMSRSSGTPIGSGSIGPRSIGSGGASPPTGYRFTYPPTVLFSGETFQFEIEIFDEGTAMELRDSRLDYETDGESVFTHL